MDKKRVIMMNVLVIGAILLLSLAALIASKLLPRQITPNAGPLEMEFEPAAGYQHVIDVCEEDFC